jgi:hypothetical protein
MKKGFIVSLAFIVALCATGAFAAQPLGGPADAEPGKLALAFGYFYSQDKWTSNTISGSFDPKVETMTYYGQLAYGLAPGWDVYVRAGAVGAKLMESNVDFKSDGNFFAGLGMHGKLFEKKDWNLVLGPIANATYYSNWTDRSGNVLPTGTGLASITMKDHYSFNVGFGFQWTPIQFLTIYGGPFYNYETAKLEATGRLGGIPFSSSNNIDTDKSFGTRLGIRIPIKKEFSINIEGQMKDYASVGGWINFNF